MFSVFPAISASTKRLIILPIASALLLAAGQVPQTADVSTGPTISDQLLAPMTPAEAAASAAALAATTPADIAAVADNSDASAADVASEARPVRLAALIDSVDADGAMAADSDLRCLATAVYFESRGEPLEGQLAVAQSIMNRVASGRYASNVCGVVNQPNQFSYDRSRAPRAGSDWTTAQSIAMVAMKAMWHQVAPKALSFHATYVSPNWRGKTRIAQIGRHVFYK